MHSDASDVENNSQFALPPRNPTLGINTKRSSTNKLHVYENVDVCSNNLEDTKLRLQQVDTSDTITTCDDIPVYLSGMTFIILSLVCVRSGLISNTNPNLSYYRYFTK